MGEITDADRREFRELAYRYARSADRRRYDDFLEITTPDAIIAVHYGDPAEVEASHSMQGHAQIPKAMSGLEMYSKTMHVVANQLVELDGADRASGETYCVAHHLYEEGGVVIDHTMYIRYQDKFERRNGRWLFSERRLAVDFTSDRPLEMK